MNWRRLIGALGVLALAACSDPAAPRIPEPEEEEEEEPDPSPGVTATGAAFPQEGLFFI